jgi:phytoene synthase
MFDGDAQHPVTRALIGPITACNLPLEYFQEIIDGMEMDLDYPTYDSFRDLSLYCYRAAGVVGLMSAEIFGYEDRRTLQYAQDLGTAMQLTNILRDVREDAARGRIYIPRDELRACQVEPQQILNNIDSERIRRLLKTQADRARQYYQRALSELPDIDRERQRSGLIMAEIYLALLNEIESDNFNVMRHRISLTPLRKFWIAWKTQRREKRLQKRLVMQG